MSWHRLSLTVVQTPLLKDKESSIYSAYPVGLYSGDTKLDKYTSGWIYLTTHRVCYVDDKLPQENSISLVLSRIETLAYIPKFLRASPKVLMTIMPEKPVSAFQRSPWICPICTFSNSLAATFVLGISNLPICDNCGVPPPTETIEAAVRSNKNKLAPLATKAEESMFCPRCTFANHISLLQCEMCGETLKSPQNTDAVNLGSPVKISFRGGGSREFFRRLKEAHQELEFETDNSNPPKRTSQESSTDSLSLPEIQWGIRRLEQAASYRAPQNAEPTTPLHMLEHLKSRVDELKRLSALLGRPIAQNQHLKLRGASVSRGMAKNRQTYLQQLARQIAEFVETTNILRAEGGILSLYAVFAIYNRARGVDLVTPQDMVEAMAMAENLGLPVVMRQSSTGVRVLEEKHRTSPQQRVVSWLSRLEPWRADAGVSARDVSAKFGWSISVALEELEEAERVGVICRDEVPQGVFYFENNLVKNLEDLYTV